MAMSQARALTTVALALGGLSFATHAGHELKGLSGSLRRLHYLQARSRAPPGRRSVIRGDSSVLKLPFRKKELVNVTFRCTHASTHWGMRGSAECRQRHFHEQHQYNTQPIIASCLAFLETEGGWVVEGWTRSRPHGCS